jgi:uncharacterized protein Usg
MTILRHRTARYLLTTAEILYYMPDHPALLQSFVWQNLDLAPHFPVLKKFLRYWEGNIEGRLHSVSVANRQLDGPASIRFADSSTTLH